MSAGPPIAFSTLAFPGASVATALSLGGAWGYGGVELRLIDGELIDPSMPAAARAEARRAAAAAGLPIVAVDSCRGRLGQPSPAPHGPAHRRWLPGVDFGRVGEAMAPKEIEEPKVALPQHLRLLESWLRDPQEAV